jgi:hypothetical protein
MGATTQKLTFDQIYQKFGADYLGKQMMDWSNYVKAYGSGNYYVWCDLVALWPTNKIPYWDYATGPNGYLSGGKAAGYLPADLGAFYLKMRPVSVGDKNLFMKVVTSKLLSVNNVLKYFNPISLALSYFESQSEKTRFDAMKKCADVHFFDEKLGKYRTVKVPIDPKYFSLKFYAYDGKQFEEKKDAILLLNKEVGEYAKQLSLQYNRAELLINHKNFSKLDAVIQARAKAYKQDAENRIEALSNDPTMLAKKCKECANNAVPESISAVPLVLVIVIAAVAIGAGVFTVAYITNRWKEVQTQKVQSKRIYDDLMTWYKIASDPNISAEDKKAALEMINTDVESAQKTVSNEESKPGFFDRIENLALMVGGFILLNNLTKNSNNK